MGAESSILKELDFEDGPPKPDDISGSMPRKARQKDGTRVSVFVYEKGSKEDDSKDNAAKQLKILRHPGIVRFLNWCKCTEGRLLITESVQPLEAVLEQLTAAEVCAGFYNIIEALVFLHDRGGLCHNNVCLQSIFVDEEGCWKLGGMEYLCRFEQATPAYLEKCRSTRNQAALPPEEKSGELCTGQEYGHVRDVYSFGILAESLMEYLQDIGDMTKTFELRVQDECLNLDPKGRPKMSSLLQDRLFQNEYLEIINFLRNITLKSDEEKQAFFGSVVCKLHRLPEEVVAKRLVRPLVSRFVLLESSATKHLLPHLLVPARGSTRDPYVEGNINPVLSEGLFKSYVIPQLFKIFHVRDAHIRLVLLKNFSSYVNLFDPRTLRAIILPQVLVGVRDSNDELVAASLHALAELVPLLGGDTVIGSHRFKLFAEGIPKFTVSSKESAFQPKRKSVPKAIIGNGDSNGPSKPTLKELAKDAEKNQKREEARKRREERRAQREEALRLKTLQDDVLTVSLDVSREKRHSDSSPDSRLTNDTTELHIPAPVQHSESDDGRIPSTQISPSDGDKGDWSDWENPEKSDSSVDYDEQIENEISAMDSTLSPDKVNKLQIQNKDDKNSPGFSPGHRPQSLDYVSSSPVRTAGGKGALKLKVPKTKLSPPPEAADTQTESRTSSSGRYGHVMSTDVFSDWGAGWEDEMPSDLTDEQSGSHTSPTRSSHSSPAKQQQITAGSKHSSPARQKQDVLGAEYDIMSIDIKTSSKGGLFDFFADMEPTISKQTSLHQTLSGPETSETSQVKGQAQTGLSFAVQDTDVDGSGWDDDWD